RTLPRSFRLLCLTSLISESLLIAQHHLRGRYILGVHLLSQNRARAFPGHVNELANGRIGRGVERPVSIRTALIKGEIPTVATRQQSPRGLAGGVGSKRAGG